MPAESLEDMIATKYNSKVTVRSKEPSKVFTEKMTVGEFFGNTQDIPILLYYMQKI